MAQVVYHHAEMGNAQLIHIADLKIKNSLLDELKIALVFKTLVEKTARRNPTIFLRVWKALIISQILYF